MADTLQKNTGLKKSYLKKGNEEDPIIVAQRFLNIFRQLHIFSPERKEAFNKMVLELSPDIRGIFSSLPGGVILQEYVDDLEQQAGVSRDTNNNNAATSSEEASNSQILASALAGAQQNKQAQIQEEKPRTVPEETIHPQSSAASGKIVADASFAKEFASVFKEAMLYTEANRKKESEQLTKAILSSQNALAKMVLQNNTAAASNSSNNNANNIQINTAATFPPIEDMISGIVKAQSELFREMAKTQTEELSSIISLALKESQQMSTQTIVDAIKAFQKENLTLLSMNLSKAPAHEPPVSTSSIPVKESLPETEETILPESSVEPEEENNPDEIAVIEQEAVVSPEEEPQPKKKKKKKKNKKKKKSADVPVIDEVPTEEENFSDTDDGYEYVYVNHEDQLPTDNEDNEEWAWEYEEVPAENENEPSVSENSPALDTSLFDSDDNGNFENDIDILLPDDGNSEDDFEWQYQETDDETAETDDLSSVIDEDIPEQNSSVEEPVSDEDWEWEYAEEEVPSLSAENGIGTEETETVSKTDETETFSDEQEEEWSYEEADDQTLENGEEIVPEEEIDFSSASEEPPEDFNNQEEFTETEDTASNDTEENIDFDLSNNDDDFDTNLLNTDTDEESEDLQARPFEDDEANNTYSEPQTASENPEAEPVEETEKVLLDELPTT